MTVKNQWMSAALLATMFAIIAYAGGRSPSVARQTSSNVVVTNTSSQPVPVVPSARPTAKGAYIVSVANAPGVNVLSLPTTPLATNDVSGQFKTSGMLTGTLDLAAGVSDSGFVTLYTVPSGKRFVIGTVSAFTGAQVSGDFATELFVLVGSATVLVPMSPVPSISVRSAGSQAVELVADAGQQIQVDVQRASTMTSGLSSTEYVVTGHLISVP